ncbi:MAG: O-antigen polymerase [Verrucomicrobiales bacterium]|nr:O-antigen polymerase [Verrucomicrobiales bacterium]
MMRRVESVWLVFFLLGLLLLGSLGTWDETPPFWYGAAAVAVAGVGALLSSQRRGGRPASPFCMGIMLLFYAYVAWRALNSEVKWMARQDLVFATTAVTAYLLTALRFTAPWRRAAVLGVFALLILANTGTGLYQFFQDPEYMVFGDLGIGRVVEKSGSGFFGNSNHMAGFLILASFPLLGVAVLDRGTALPLRVLCGVVFAVAGVGIGISTSRGGVMGFFSALALFICLALVVMRFSSAGHRKSSGIGWWFSGLAGGFALLLLVTSFALKRFYGGTEVMSSLSGRGALWDAALEQFQTSPLIGTGARSYEYMERAFRTLDTKWMTWAGEYDAIYAHNDFLQCLGDYGLVGLLLALTALTVHAVHALRLISRTRSSAPAGEGGGGRGLPSGLAIGALCSLAGLAVHSLVDFNLHIGVNVVVAGILMGFLAAPGFTRTAAAPLSPSAVPQAAPDRAPPSPPPFSPMLLILSLITAGLSVAVLDAGRTLARADYYWAVGFREVKSAETSAELFIAAGTLEKAISLDPLNAKAWGFLGVVNTSVAQQMPSKFAAIFYEKAYNQLTHSLQLYPKNPYAAGLAGSLADYLRKKDEAEALFATALRWGLNIQSVNNQYGDHLAIFRKEYDKALGYYVIALSLSSDKAVRARIQQKIDKCLAKRKQQGMPASPEASLKPVEEPAAAPGNP